MGHGLTETDSMFSVRETPWHGLGVVLPEYPTRDEAQQLAHPWEPLSEPVYRRAEVELTPGYSTPIYTSVEGRKLITRSDNNAVLGDVANTLGTVSNNDLWDIAEAVGNIGAGVQIETAGSLLGGAKVWILLRLEEPLQVKGDPSATLAFFALQNSHDGSGSLRGQAINTRIVCWNTSSAADVEAKNSGHEFTFRHTSGISDRIEDAKRAVALWRSDIEIWQTAMDHLASVNFTPEQVTEFIERYQAMPPEHLITDRVRDNVLGARRELRLVLDSQTSEGVKGSAYGIFQATVEWQQHIRRTRAADEQGRRERLFTRNMLTTDRLTNRTLSLVREIANA
jgi:phage/plasmid-like protein (TIGR03299 family)